MDDEFYKKLEELIEHEWDFERKIELGEHSSNAKWLNGVAIGDVLETSEFYGFVGLKSLQVDLVFEIYGLYLLRFTRELREGGALSSLCPLVDFLEHLKIHKEELRNTPRKAVIKEFLLSLRETYAFPSLDKKITKIINSI